jgi:hypothetical protein
MIFSMNLESYILRMYETGGSIIDSVMKCNYKQVCILGIQLTFLFYVLQSNLK